MKTLILMRHAKSDWSLNGQRDFDRGLNERGYRDVLKMSVRLKEMKVNPDAIFSSSSLRTRLTAQYVCERIDFDFEQIEWRDTLYEVSLNEVLKQICEFDDHLETVMMFGHNPTYTYLVEYLTYENIGNMPTSAVAKIELDVDSWKEVSKNIGKMLWFLYPKDQD